MSFKHLNDHNWSILEPSLVYVEKLRLLCHTPEELRKHGYVIDQLSESQLVSKMRCRKCGDRRKTTGRDKGQRASFLEAQQASAEPVAAAKTEAGQNQPPTKFKCRYHDGKVLMKHFQCCNQHLTAPGCKGGPVHTFDGLTMELRLNWRFSPTTPSMIPNTSAMGGLTNVTQAHYYFLRGRVRRQAIQAVALDCEMGTAASGDSELIRITVIDFFTLERLVDRLVCPDVQMQHYNTRYSGITAATMRAAVRSKTCLFGRKAAREEFLKYVSSETIVVAHGGNNDLSALRVTHPLIIDTFILEGYREKSLGGRSLKALCASLLGISIQRGKGHDSFEDAAACRELANHWVTSIPD